jgi:hypothetical protein
MGAMGRRAVLAVVLMIVAGCGVGAEAGSTVESLPPRSISSSPPVSTTAPTTTTVTAMPKDEPAPTPPVTAGAIAPLEPSSTVPRATPPVPPTVPHRDLPPWSGSANPIDDELGAAMTGVSWHVGCPVPIADLRQLHVDHVGFDGHRNTGQLVVHADAADAVLAAFRSMYEARFPIERVTLIDEVGGSDDAAMAANLTTAFNCRRVTGGSGWSEHAYGRAIDINPVQNPYVSSRGTVLPPAGSSYLDRGSGAIGLIAEGGPAVAAWDAVGWQWGGRWQSIKDYQHFSASGR